MGTNFFTRNFYCSRCNQRLPEASEAEEIHLGKSSMGWPFALQANGYKYYKNWPEMKKWLKGKIIYDEYGGEFKPEEFIKWVENRKNIKEPEKVNDSYAKKIGGYTFIDSEFS